MFKAYIDNKIQNSDFILYNRKLENVKGENRPYMTWKVLIGAIPIQVTYCYKLREILTL